jgi:hypothetical protein
MTFVGMVFGQIGTAALAPGYLVLLGPYPFIVWGADELRRYLIRLATRRAQLAA